LIVVVLKLALLNREVSIKAKYNVK